MISKNTDSYLIKNTDCFGIKETLMSGQCFRFEKAGEGEYTITAHSRKLFIREADGGILLYPASEQDYIEIWREYFDVCVDYSKIREVLTANDEVMRAAIEYAPGIRILRQEPWECLISFIISQNNNIPRIKKIIESISVRFGDDMGGYYAFPTPSQLGKATIQDLMECGAGFRAKYILDAVGRVIEGKLDFAYLAGLQTDELREKLLEIYGVGRKVSDCAMLFSFGRTELFPVDVWVKRIMEHFYFGGESVTIDDIHCLARQKFGEYGGYAQQFLFHYARNNSANLTRLP